MSFASQSVLEVALRKRDKTNAIFQVYLLKNGCWSLPLATDGEQLVQGDSEFTKLVSRQKLYRGDWYRESYWAIMYV